MRNQKGIALIPLTIATAVLVSVSAVTLETVNDSEKVIGKVKNAEVQFAHGEVNEQLELNEQVYFIEKYTGKYNKDLIEYLKEKNFVGEDGIINMATLLGHREDRVPTGKGTDGEKDIYKAEIVTENDVKIIYYDQDGESQQIGELYGEI